MKILYAIQGTGNGHLSRAIALIPILMKKAKVDILISGNQAQLDFPFPVRYNCFGLTFIPSKKGGINLFKTIRNLKPLKFIREVKSLPVKDYDLVITDFEPVSAWACKINGVRCVELSHQAAVRMEGSPQTPKWFPLGRWIIKNYCPSNVSYGFHFEPFSDKIFYPIIRKEIIECSPVNGMHFLVYLTAYDEASLIRIFSRISGTFRIYSNQIKHKKVLGNLTIIPIGTPSFLQDLITCRGVICGAGFELPSEALFLKKALLVVPYSNHFEQHCNAEALKKLGVKILFDFSTPSQMTLEKWCQNPPVISYHWSNQLEFALETVISTEELVGHAVPAID